MEMKMSLGLTTRKFLSPQLFLSPQQGYKKRWQVLQNCFSHAAGASFAQHGRLSETEIVRRKRVQNQTFRESTSVTRKNSGRCNRGRRVQHVAGPRGGRRVQYQRDDRRNEGAACTCGHVTNLTGHAVARHASGLITTGARRRSRRVSKGERTRNARSAAA